MKHRIKVAIFCLVVALAVWPVRAVPAASTLAVRLKGRILLQAESHGEAWYVHPETLQRQFLGRPADAFRVMRDLGTGIANADLARIRIAVPAVATGNDSDRDGLTDAFETAIGSDPRSGDSDRDGFGDRRELADGFDPAGTAPLSLSAAFTSRQAGRILLQVQSHGEAWYVDPVRQERRYLGRPDDAFALMRSLGLGITDRDLATIIVAAPDLPAGEFERVVFDRINAERRQAGLGALVWNDELAAVARRHSDDLAAENGAFTGFGMSCDYPFIHHEGSAFGLFNGDRLNASGVHYFARAGENIALLTAAKLTIRTTDTAAFQSRAAACEERRDRFERDYQTAIKDLSDEAKRAALARSVAGRTAAFAAEQQLTVSSAAWTALPDLAAEMVAGWMNSPGHRANIMEAEYGETGIGFARMNGYVFGTQIFIKRAACGFETGPCCAEPGYYPFCFVPLRCDAGACRE